MSRDPFRGVVAALVGLVLVALVLTAITGFFVIAGLVIAVAVLNLVYLPRAAAWLRLPSSWLALMLIPFMILAGELIAGNEGAAWSMVLWLVAIGLPRALAGDVVRRLRRRMDTRMRIYDA